MGTSQVTEMGNHGKCVNDSHCSSSVAEHW